MKFIYKLLIIFLILGMFVMSLFVSVNDWRRYEIKQAQDQYYAWTNYTKRTDVTLVEFIQLKDIGVLR